MILYFIAAAGTVVYCAFYMRHCIKRKKRLAAVLAALCCVFPAAVAVLLAVALWR